MMVALQLEAPCPEHEVPQSGDEFAGVASSSKSRMYSRSPAMINGRCRCLAKQASIIDRLVFRRLPTSTASYSDTISSNARDGCQVARESRLEPPRSDLVPSPTLKRSSPLAT